MKAEYKKWIDTFRKMNPFPYGMCKHTAELMHTQFPELIIVPGNVETIDGKEGHWWLKTSDGEIIDPTRHQFRGPLVYEAWTPDSLVQIGKCMNCGDEIWRKVPTLNAYYHQDFCNKECENDFMEDLNKPRSYTITNIDDDEEREFQEPIDVF